MALLVVLAAWHVATAPPDEALALPTAPDAAADEPPRDAAPLAATTPTPAEPAREEAPAEAAPDAAAARPAADVPERAVLRVHVVSATDGTPVREARVGLHVQKPDLPADQRSAGAPDGTRARLDDEGWIHFAALPGAELTLFAFEDRHWHRARRELAPLQPGEQREVVLELTPVATYRFFGRVVRAVDGTPVPGARVRQAGVDPARFSADPASWKRTAPSPVLADRLTDADGCFDVEARSDEHVGLRVDAEGFAPAFVTPVRGHDSRADARLVELTAGATLAVLLLDARASPLGDVEVRATPPVWRLVEREAIPAFSRGLEWAATTGAEGRATLGPLPAHVPFAVEAILAEGPIRAAEDVTLAPGEIREIELRAGSDGRIVGVLVDQHGAPIAEHPVWCVPAKGAFTCVGLGDRGSLLAETRTDAAGEFSLEGIPPGAWRVAPTPADLEVVPVATRVEITPDAPLHHIRMEAPRGLFLEGVVLDPEGVPTSAVGLAAYADSGCPASGEPSETGAFRIGPVSDGWYSLMIFPRAGHARPDPIRARPGEPLTVQLSAGASLRVRARDASTGELRHARVSCKRVGAEHGPYGSSMIGSDTELALRGLRPGPHDVRAWTADGLAGVLPSVDVPAAGEPPVAEVPLLPGGTLRVRRPSGARPRIAVVQGGVGVAVDRVDRRGSDDDLLYRLPPGAAEVQVLDPGGDVLARHDVRIAAGEETVVDLRPPEDPSR